MKEGEFGVSFKFFVDGNRVWDDIVRDFNGVFDDGYFYFFFCFKSFFNEVRGFVGEGSGVNWGGYFGSINNENLRLEVEVVVKV